LVLTSKKRSDSIVNECGECDCDDRYECERDYISDRLYATDHEYDRDELPRYVESEIDDTLSEYDESHHREQRPWIESSG
jgi:hypothetical protein